MASFAAVQRRLALMLAAASLACAPAPRMGEAVDIAEESAIIIWNAAERTQHFIRRASFRTQARDFGFLVPTPSVPELKEADDAAFDLLERITAPPVLREAAKSEVAKAAPPAAAPQVVVVAKAKVAGYDAAVLKANDAGALDGWLKTNGYHSSPELLGWYKPYIEKKWIITAFKIDAEGGRAEGAAVRMSFQTDQPFFPYREPAAGKDSRSDSRLLQVYFVGDFRPEGRIGASAAWPGRTVWSGDLQGGDKKRLFDLLKLPETAGTRLTRFSDGSSPRPGHDDLFFSAAADQSLVPDPRRMAEQKAAIEAEERERRGGVWGGLLLLLAIVAALAFAVWRSPRAGE